MDIIINTASILENERLRYSSLIENNPFNTSNDLLKKIDLPLLGKVTLSLMPKLTCKRIEANSSYHISVKIRRIL